MRLSSHLNVPNGMDPPTHTDFRRIIDRYFTVELDVRLRRGVRAPCAECPLSTFLDGQVDRFCLRSAEFSAGGGLRLQCVCDPESARVNAECDGWVMYADGSHQPALEHRGDIAVLPQL